MTYDAIRQRLKQEIIVNESFYLPPFTKAGPKEAIDFLFSPAFKTGTIPFRLKAITHTYPLLFKYIPIIKIVFPEHLLESELLLLTKEEFCQKLRIKI